MGVYEHISCLSVSLVAFLHEYPCLGIVSPRALAATPSSTVGERVEGKRAGKWERCWDSCFTSMSVRWIGLWRNNVHKQLLQDIVISS